MMKLSDFRQMVDKLDDALAPWEDKEVVIVTSERRMVGTQSTGVKSVSWGFDWDSGKILIFPDVPVVKVKENGTNKE